MSRPICSVLTKHAVGYRSVLPDNLCHWIITGWYALTVKVKSVGWKMYLNGEGRVIQLFFTDIKLHMLKNFSTFTSKIYLLVFVIILIFRNHDLYIKVPQLAILVLTSAFKTTGSFYKSALIVTISHILSIKFANKSLFITEKQILKPALKVRFLNSISIYSISFIKDLWFYFIVSSNGCSCHAT